MRVRDFECFFRLGYLMNFTDVTAMDAFTNFYDCTIGIMLGNYENLIMYDKSGLSFTIFILTDSTASPVEVVVFVKIIASVICLLISKSI